MAEPRESNAPAINPESINVLGASRLVQQVYASLLMNTAAGTEAHSIVDGQRQEMLGRRAILMAMCQVEFERRFVLSALTGRCATSRTKCRRTVQMQGEMHEQGEGQ